MDSKFRKLSVIGKPMATLEPTGSSKTLITGKPVTSPGPTGPSITTSVASATANNAGGSQPSSTSRKRKGPSRKRRADLRLATKMVSQLSARPATSLTPAQVNSLEWAKGVCEGTVLDAQSPQAAIKRQRSLEGGSKPGPSSKRHKSHPVIGRSFSDVAKDSLIIGVLDEGSQDGRIPKDKWRLVEGAILTVFMDIVSENPGPVPICEDAGWHQGSIKLIGCSDERAARLYKSAISRVGEVWKGAKLKAVDKVDIPSRPRARVWVPANSPTDPLEILRIINHCNPSIPAKEWKVVKVEDPVGTSRQIVLVLNQESLKPLEEAKSQIRFGFTSVPLRVYKVDAHGGKPAESRTEGKVDNAEKYPNSEVSDEVSDEALPDDDSGSITDLWDNSGWLLDGSDHETTVVEASTSEGPPNDEGTTN